MTELTVQTLLNRERTYHGIYHDVGEILDNYSTEELFRFVSSCMNMDTALRYYLEQSIVRFAASLKTDD